jgi:hypothetical protein
MATHSTLIQDGALALCLVFLLFVYADFTGQV